MHKRREWRGEDLVVKELHPKAWATGRQDPPGSKVKRVNSQFQALTMDGLLDNSIQGALTNDPGEPQAMEDSGAYH
eukprot:12886738-Prorocentrum_lima.AAC.1